LWQPYGLEAANASSAIQFVVRKWAIGGGYYVSVLKRGEQVDTITGFAKEFDAVDWIKEKSASWQLAQRKEAANSR
jgi:hypothetical protein